MSGAAARPAIFLVAEADAHERIAEEFGSRYAHDYELVVCSSGAETLERLHQGMPVAMVGATMSLPDGDALDLLAAAHEIVPSARRVALVIGVGRAPLDVLRPALAEGRIDAWLAIPSGPRDEEFHGAVSELLSEWAWTSQSVGVDGVQVVADRKTPELSRLVDFLQRMGLPHRRYSPDSEVGAAIVAEAGRAEFPMLRAFSGDVIVRPTLADLGAVMFGRPSDLPADFVADALIVGSGPAGLAAAVYAASEGLQTVVIESEAIGGQAGTSSMIRNYLGFPRGISGMRLTQRARIQAGRFGARFFVGAPVAALEPGDPHTLVLEDGTRLRGRAIVIATGAQYRRLGVESIEELNGRGVHYGAATSVARDLQGRRVYIVGGGNSAGQAAMHLARFAAEVTIVVRRDGLAETMSDYLIRELNGSSRVVVLPHTAVTDGNGAGRLEWIELTDVRDGTRRQVPADALMLLLGAEPCTEWLPDKLDLDDKGFVLTGRDVPADCWIDGLPPAALATEVPGVFAVGDIRSGSMKRVASASGEGAAVVPLIHAWLASLQE